jgi:hypothetical protein
MPYQLENFFPGDPQHSYKKNEAVKLFQSLVSTATRVEIALRRVGIDQTEMARFNRWFGPTGPNNAHLEEVKRNLKNIVSSVMNRTIVLRNSSDGAGAEMNPATGRRRTGAELGDVAYVRPQLNNLKVYLLPAFFMHHRIGQFTGAGVIFHELSHVFADTDDHCYMVHPCRNLAQNHPDLARNNADNYRLYFEEFLR